MRIGLVLLPELDWTADRLRWQRVEALGFPHAWTYDHLAWRSLADGPWHATIPTLTAAALSTSTLRLGTWVTTPNFRHPVPLAKDLMTLDNLAGGRLSVGLGAGAPGYDASVLDQPALSLGQRGQRFTEFVTLLDRLLSQDRTTWSGNWFSAVDARMMPGPVQRPRPPFVVAANGPRGMRLAQQFGSWVTTGTADRDADTDTWWEGVRVAGDQFEELLAARSGPAPAPDRYLNLELRTGAVTSVERLRDDVGRAAALGFTDVVYAYPRPGKPFRAPESLLDVMAGELSALAAGPERAAGQGLAAHQAPAAGQRPAAGQMPAAAEASTRAHLPRV
ncbi:MAG: class flavin-dependent oxidoreductase [Friedmanniella sp.]|nr:class flavin-dependent oxidoreductase [Friedmanniella sp.]